MSPPLSFLAAFSDGNGIVYAGAPLGCIDFVQNYIIEKLASNLPVVRALHQLNNAQSSFWCLLKSFSSARGTFLTRVVPTSFLEDDDGNITLFHAYDEAILQSLIDLLPQGCTLDSIQHSLVRLPFNRSGLALYSTEDTAHAAHVASVSACWPL